MLKALNAGIHHAPGAYPSVHPNYFPGVLRFSWPLLTWLFVDSYRFDVLQVLVRVVIPLGRPAFVVCVPGWAMYGLAGRGGTGQ